MNDQPNKRRSVLFRMKPRFQLIWLFLLTTIVAVIFGVFTRRQDSLDAELMKLAGTWDPVKVDDFDYIGTSFDFEDPRFKLIRPGVFEVKLANDDVVYGVYKKDGNLLYYNESLPGCACPTDIEDLKPAVHWNASGNVDHLYTEPQRVRQYLLRLNTDDDTVERMGKKSGNDIQLQSTLVEDDVREAFEDVIKKPQ